MNQNLYIQLVDDIFEEINQKSPKTADEAWEVMQKIKYEKEEELDSTLDEILDDYCEEKGLEWTDND